MNPQSIGHLRIYYWSLVENFFFRKLYVVDIDLTGGGVTVAL